MLISCWRLALAGAAWFGFLSAMTNDFERLIWRNLNYFSQIGSLLVGITAVGALLSPLWNAGAIEGRRGFLRGASTTYALLILLVYPTLLREGYASNASKFEHLIVPIMALVDWIVVGRNSSRLRAWWPLGWLLIPLIYLPVYIGASHQRGRPLYGFLDPDAGDFWLWAVALLVGFLLIGYLVLAVGRLRRVGPGAPVPATDPPAGPPDQSPSLPVPSGPPGPAPPAPQIRPDRPPPSP